MKKKPRARLMRLAAQPALHRWTTGPPLRLVAQGCPQGALDPKAVGCSGVLRLDTHEVWLRLVEGRPVSDVTPAFLTWLCERLAREPQRVLGLSWDHASWPLSQEVGHWIRAPKQQAKQTGGLRLLVGRWPGTNPWLTPIAPHWVPSRPAMVEPARLLTAAEVISRVCDYCEAAHLEPLAQKIA